jgi:hypothetical protein
MKRHTPQLGDDMSNADETSAGGGFWVSDDLDWIMYASHEGTITVGGLLGDAVRKVSPAIKEFDWLS